MWFDSKTEERSKIHDNFSITAPPRTRSYYEYDEQIDEFDMNT